MKRTTHGKSLSEVLSRYAFARLYIHNSQYTRGYSQYKSCDSCWSCKREINVLRFLLSLRLTLHPIGIGTHQTKEESSFELEVSNVLQFLRHEP